MLTSGKQRHQGFRYLWAETIEVFLIQVTSNNNLQQNKKMVYDTAYSQAVTHPSTDAARRCLTSVIGRELVVST